MRAGIAKGRVVDKLKRGQIIWANFIDPQGRGSGLHPAMILTSSEDIQRGEPIFAVVISTKLKYAKTEEMIEMRYLDKRLGRGGHPVTKLDKKCAAICQWVNQKRGHQGVGRDSLRFGPRANHQTRA